MQVLGKMAVGEKLTVHIHKPNGEKPSVKPHLLRDEGYAQMNEALKQFVEGESK